MPKPILCPINKATAARRALEDMSGRPSIPLQKAAKEAFNALRAGKKIPRHLLTILEDSLVRLSIARKDRTFFHTAMVLRFKNDLLSDLWLAWKKANPTIEGSVHPNLKESDLVSQRFGEWALVYTRGTSLELLGEELYALVRRDSQEWWSTVARVMVAIGNVPDGAFLRGSRKDSLVEKVMKPIYRDLLERRLTKLDMEPVKRTEFPKGLINVVQGNVGEITALPAIRDDFLDLKNKYPEGKLIIGALWTDASGKRKEFSDYLFLTEVGDDVIIHAAWEVKTDPRGMATAVDSIHGRLTKVTETPVNRLSYTASTREVSFGQDGLPQVNKIDNHVFPGVNERNIENFDVADRIMIVPGESINPQWLRSTSGDASKMVLDIERMNELTTKDRLGTFSEKVYVRQHRYIFEDGVEHVLTNVDFRSLTDTFCQMIRVTGL